MLASGVDGTPARRVRLAASRPPRARGGVSASPRPTRQHQRHLLAGARQLLQRPERLLRIAQGLDTVVTGVAPDELSLDILESVLVFIDDEEDWKRHLVCSTLASHHRRQQTSAACSTNSRMQLGRVH